MKEFFKYVFATIIGILIFWFISIIIFSGLVGSAVKSSYKDVVKIEPNSVLKLDFVMPIQDRPSEEPIFGGGFLPSDIEGNYGLRPTIKAIEAAMDDDRIRGIYIKPDQLSIGFANLKELEVALKEFKDSGKFIIADSRYCTQKAYGLASIADEYYLHPEGYFDFKGFSSQSMFIKGMLDKLGVEPMIFYAGKYKSATEPLRRTNMSEENKLQTREFLEDIYGNYLEMVSENRDIPVETLRDIADNLKIKTVQDAVDLGLVDGTKYDDEVMAIIREKIGVDEDKDINFVSLLHYSEAKEIGPHGNNAGSNRIAVVYAEGDIIMGDSDDTGSIQGDAYMKLLEKIRKNDKIKAVVLRVNSPGGSAFASDLIWREIELLKKEKPVIVSMGNLAASGGYYISANSDRIFAEKTTITGSIGVFATLFNTESLLKNKLGITTDGISTGNYSDFPNPNKKWSEEEKLIMQNQVDGIYDSFMGKVAEGRGLSVEQVNEIAQGRVWSGQDAIEIGLVDEIGDLQDAIDYAAKTAEIDNPEISIYPRQKTEWERIEDMFNIEAKADKMFDSKMKEYGPLMEQLELISTYSEPQMRLPMDIEIK